MGGKERGGKGEEREGEGGRRGLPEPLDTILWALLVVSAGVCVDRLCVCVLVRVGGW